MRDEIFQDCLKHQIKSEGKTPYWDGLFEKYKDEYNTREQLRSAYKREKRRRAKEGAMPEYDYAERRSYEEKDGFINVVCASRRLLTKEDIIEEFKIDMNEWEVDYFKQKSSEGYRKDRSVQWEVRNGEVKYGSVDDTGKMLVVPLYHLEVRFRPRRYKFTEKNIDNLFESIKSKDFKTLQIKPKQYYSDGITPIIPIPDLHFGLISSKKVEGEDYNIDIATRRVESIIAQAKDIMSGRKIKEIIFIIGNDMFNSDNIFSTTTKGTQQDTAYSWFELVDSALELFIRSINSLREVSKVRVINVQSNHDMHTGYSTVKMLEQYFKDCDDVSFDNRPTSTKYLVIGKTLFGLTHDIPKKRALEIITSDLESKPYWSRAKQAVWILAHLHNSMKYETEGVMEIYRLPAICNRSRWTVENHFSRSDARTQMFLVDDEYGILGTMNIFVD